MAQPPPSSLLPRYAKNCLIGFSRSDSLSFVLPTAIVIKGCLAVAQQPSCLTEGADLSCYLSAKRGIEDLDYFIGDESSVQALGQGPHGALLPLNPSESCQNTPEIMLETFNCAELYIAWQAVLALVASCTSSRVQDQSLTITIVDSGDGVTDVIPIAEGYVIGSSIQSIPIAGRDITEFVQSLLHDRNEPDCDLKTAEKIKEKFCYACPDVVKEFTRFDREIEGFRKSVVVQPKGRKVTVDMLFNPRIHTSDFLMPLPTVVDTAIQRSLIDVREEHCSFWCSTLYLVFGRCFERDIRHRVDACIRKSEEKSGGFWSGGLEVQVIAHQRRKHGVWSGGSLLSQSPEFRSYFHTRAEYDEIGPSLVRSFA
ncbi:hypothetical protein B9Z19DRAFT_1103744 [Tuber borchii]|uniref:Actin family n=1 Tax=Tuber borchii TaxID=42251 RepID=A0A2T6ZEE6_TUBBO|nr:hypothetical protein B9Z19DRAFT_1103744 [Tuber borchii]